MTSKGQSTARWRWPAIVFAVAAGWVLASLPFDGASVRVVSAASQADDLLIVDCLLPGKARRLGTRVTYVTARKAVKTTASDCAIRGGEYTSADRASYDTALKIWMPLAQAGDAEAQTYVGEIFEKGLGVEPQHAMAARWYQLAAEQGHSRAQMNLGALYENGLGVPKDKAKAFEWYSKASGLEAGSFVPGEVQEELETLRQERQDLQRERDQLRRTLDGVRDELDRAREELERRADAAASGRAELDAARERLQRELAAGRQDRVVEVTRELTARSRELEQRDSEVADLKARLAALDRQAKSLQSNLSDEAARREQEIERYRAEAKAAKAQLRQVTSDLDVARSDLNVERRQAESARRSLDTVREQLEAEVAAGREERIAQLSAELSRKSTDLLQREQQVADLTGRLGDLQQQAETLKTTLTTELGAREEEIREVRSEAEAAKAALGRLGSRLEEAESALAAQRKRTEARRGEVEALKGEINRLRQSAERDKAREEALQQQIADRELALDAERERAAELSATVESPQGETERVRSEAAKRAEAEKAQLAGGPVIEIIDPQIPVTRATEPATVAIKAKAERLVIGKVRADGELLGLTVNDVELTPNDAGVFRAKVPITDARTKVTVVAIDGSGRRSTSEFVLARAAGTAAVRSAEEGAKPAAAPETLDIEFGTFHALVIGNNDYKFLPKLETAANDAAAVGNLLQSQYGYEVKTLLNADRYALLPALNELRKELTEDDNLLIYYAGHGELDRVNSRGHWLPVDAEPDSTTNWISNIQITDVLNAMSVRQVLVVADSCYSGTLTRSAIARLDAGMSEQKRSKWFQLMADKRARVVISSGGVQPVLDSASGEHSIFAQAVLDVLSANDRILEGQRLFALVSKKAAVASAEADFDQVPEYAPIKYAGHEAGDFFFVPESR